MLHAAITLSLGGAVVDIDIPPVSIDMANDVLYELFPYLPFPFVYSPFWLAVFKRDQQS